MAWIQFISTNLLFEKTSQRGIWNVELDVWIEDASIAAIFIQLEAEALGLGSTWIQMRLREGKDGSAEAQFRRDFAVPKQYAVLCVIAIGHKNENKPARNDEYLDWKKVHQDKF